MESHIKYLEDEIRMAYANYKKMTEDGKVRNDLLGVIFERYVAIQLTQEHKEVFKCYNQIECDFKEINQLSPSDTGIDLSNETDTIVQCKFYKGNVNWNKLGTFFGSQNNVDPKTGKTYVRWPTMVIAHVSELGRNVRRQLVKDKTYVREKFIEYIDGLMDNKMPILPVKQQEEEIKQNPPPSQEEEIKQNPPPSQEEIKQDPLRPYQKDYVSWVQKEGNRIVHLPTGSGKTRIVLFAINGKSLILTPRINLAEDIMKRCEILRPDLKACQIGGGKTKLDPNADITVVVYNSIEHIKDFSIYKKIFIDEAHHVAPASIYEDCDVKSNFSKQMANLSKFNNNVYLSATIDPRIEFDYKHTLLRNMIEDGYLSDYYITVPVFSKSLGDSVMCEYVIGRDLRNLLVFAPSVKDAISFSEALNAKCPGFSAVVHSGNSNNGAVIPGTSQKNRKEIEEKFKSGELSCIVNYSIYSEGSDLPNVSNIMMLRMPGSKTAIIQIVGRGLRKIKNKPNLNVIIPTSSQDEKASLKKFMRVLADNDHKIAQSVRNIARGKPSGRISIDIDDSKESEFLGEEILRDFNLIRDWYVIFNEVKVFVELNKRLPTKNEENGYWISHQITNYKKNKGSMSIPDRRELIKNLFESIGESQRLIVPDRDPWYDKFDEIKAFVELNKRLPTRKDENGQWIGTQTKNYKKNKESMSIPDRRELIKNLYESIGESHRIDEGKDPWYNKFEEVKAFVELNKRLPLRNEENGQWVGDQTKNYKKNKESMMLPDRRELIKNLFESIGESYRINEGKDPWYNKFDEVKAFVELNKRLPNSRNEENGKWVSHQITNYKKNKESMSIPDRKELIKNLFESVNQGKRLQPRPKK